MDGRRSQGALDSSGVGIGRPAEAPIGLESVLNLPHPPPDPPGTVATAISSFAGTFPTTLHDHKPHSTVTSVRSTEASDQGGGKTNRQSASGTNRHSANSTGYGGTLSKEVGGGGLFPLPTLLESVDEGVDKSGGHLQAIVQSQLSAQQQQVSLTQRMIEEDDELFRQMRERQQRWQREADESALRVATNATAALLDTATEAERKLQQRQERRSQLEEASFPIVPLPPILAPSPSRSLPALIPLR